jgi:hypothetical protein
MYLYAVSAEWISVASKPGRACGERRLTPSWRGSFIGRRWGGTTAAAAAASEERAGH